MDTTSTTAASSITNPANYILVAADGTLLSIQSATASSNPTGNINDGRTLSDPGQLIVANSNRNNVSTAALTGNGVIGALSDYALPSVSPPSPPTVATPVAVQMADLTGDGIPDLVVVNAGTNQVDIFQGRSTSAGGGFSQSPDLILSLAAGAAPRAGSLVVADLHDNLNTAPATNRFLDLATANSAAPTDLSSPADSVNDYSVSVMMNAAATAPATFPAARVSSF